MEIILAIAIFVLLMSVFFVIYAGLSRKPSRSVHAAMERYATLTDLEEPEINLRYQRKLSQIELLDRLLAHSGIIGTLDDLVQQSGVRILADTFIFLSLALGMAGALAANLLVKNPALTPVVGLICLVQPYLWLLHKRKQRLAKFEELFPDALDLLGYSLRAGHSIMAGLKMVADDSVEPVRSEISRVVEEINFGHGVDAALRGFARRIGIAEVRFFSTCIIIQRETGGNLAELLDKVSSIVRARFRFRERVRALSAEGKISGLILTLLPFAVAVILFILNRAYLSRLVLDPLGPYFIAGALVMMSIGIFIMNRLIKLEM